MKVTKRLDFFNQLNSSLEQSVTLENNELVGCVDPDRNLYSYN